MPSPLGHAVYARKSDEDARQEDHKSTARQVEHARRYVEDRGGGMLPEHVYADEESGAEFRGRPGLLRLLTAVENGRPFNALVMSEQSRLARLTREIARAEARVQEIAAELARLEAAPALTTLDLQRMERDAASALSRFTDLLKGNVPRARQALKKLLVDRMEFTPVETKGGKRVYRFRGELSSGAVIGSTAWLVAPTGIEPVFRP